MLMARIQPADGNTETVPSYDASLSVNSWEQSVASRNIISLTITGYRILRVQAISRYVNVYFLLTKDEAPNMIIDLINQVQRNLKAQILTIQTVNGTEFKNEKLRAFYAKLEVSDNSAANTLDNELTSSSSSIVVEEDEAPQIVSSSAEQVTTEPNFPVLNENTDEFVQEDVADFDGNVLYNAPPTHVFEEAGSSSTYQDPSNMHEFHQKDRSSDRWTKNHPIEQVIGDLSKVVMTRNRLQTDAEVCMYALKVSAVKPKNIKEAMFDSSWIESMQDELNQFKCLDV
ncbi:hypothetical protein Tco_0333448 [Tanacetum coccineum]